MSQWKNLFLFSVAALFFFSGCDTSSPDRVDGPSEVTREPPNGQGGSGFANPILLGIESVTGGQFGQDDGVLCAGSVVTLNGFNFSEDLIDHRIAFSAGQATVLGMPIDIEVDRASVAPGQPVPSKLEVIVPAGLTQGTLQVFVRGVSAGAIGYDSCPSLYAATIGPMEDQDALQYQPLVGFAMGTRLTIYGLNLSDVQAVTLGDDSGGTQEVPASAFIRNTLLGGGLPNTGTVPTGYESFSIVLNDDETDIRFPFTNPPARANMSIQVRGPSGVSNTLQVPVVTSVGSQEIGAAINAIRVPTGISTGSVPIDYQIYDRKVNASWFIHCEWRIDGVTDAVPISNELPNSSGWVEALPDIDDPRHSGTEELIPGTIFHDTGERLFPGGGLIRTFVWDAQCDPLFRRLNEIAQGTTSLGGPDWKIRFRIRTEPDAGTRSFDGHTVETPSILYLDLEDTESGSLVAARRGMITESFENDGNEDFTLTTANWGPPLNIGLLTGDVVTSVSQFGQGLAALRLENQFLDTLPGQGAPVDQFFVIDTDRMEVTHRVLREDPNTPGAVNEDVIELDLFDADGNQVENPGEDAGEFHLASFEILNTDLDNDPATPDEVTRCFVRGSRPLVIRVAGTGGTPDPFADTCVIEGIFDLSGLPGQNGNDGDPQMGPPGTGGAGVAGGGDGGDGAMLQADNLANVIGLQVAERGGNAGGGGGETPAATSPATDRNSLLAGAPGGGGGHRTRGFDGEYGTSNVSDFIVPKVGFGGPTRGEESQVPQTAGSGGGGGGATLSFIFMTTMSLATGGAGGGGGGGALRLVVQGNIDVSGSILANGGAGGSGSALAGGFAPGGAGGGGSGGSIVCQATGDIRAASCDTFQVNGGEAGMGGNSNNQNRGGNSGDGAPGYVRLESAMGGSPFCLGILQASAVLTRNLSNRATTNQIEVDSVEGFPDSGTVRIEDEIISYASVNVADNELEGLSRNPLTRVAHDEGLPVVLQATIVPREESEALLGGGLTQGPDEIEFGLGRDGALHLRFIASLDPSTGEAVTDPTTGEAISIWTFDTDSGTLSAPNGEVALTTRQSNTRPGFLDLVSLRIDTNVVLRGVGSQPLEVSARDLVEIFGTIDVSGSPGGGLRFSGNGELPSPGIGGEGGPGGGDGGDGGTIRFVDGDPTNVAAHEHRSRRCRARQVAGAVGRSAGHRPQRSPRHPGRRSARRWCEPRWTRL